LESDFCREWIKREKQTWASIFRIEETENGFKVLTSDGKILQDVHWDTNLYKFVKPKDCYCFYSYWYESDDLLGQHIEVRWRIEQDFMTSLSVYFNKKKKTFQKSVYFGNLDTQREIEEEKMDTDILVKTDKLIQLFYQYVEQHPRFRIKIAMKEMESPFMLNGHCSIQRILEERNEGNVHTISSEI